MLATATKNQPVAEFESAKARWLPVKAKLAAMESYLKALRTVVAFEAASDFERKGPRLAHMRAAIAAAFPDGPPRRGLAALIEKAEGELEDFHAVVADERDRFQIAVQAESTRIGERLQPAHLAATQDIAAALETLTRAIAAADAIRAEFASSAPEPTSALLPDVTAELRQSRLDVWNSSAASWARRLREMRILP
ncbi:MULTISPECIES: hypothetical protein [unclassified Afipia]|uniref:hypothetical protein n=1 Tax=unclassified Afipia TaxID=2642050 RepID=UPI000414AB17|nr:MULTISPECIES: hypothetical protein [unclassified Afipia]